jgi:hypothetical protein
VLVETRYISIREEGTFKGVIWVRPPDKEEKRRARRKQKSEKKEEEKNEDEGERNKKECCKTKKKERKERNGQTSKDNDIIANSGRCRTNRGTKTQKERRVFGGFQEGSRRGREKERKREGRQTGNTTAGLTQGGASKSLCGDIENIDVVQHRRAGGRLADRLQSKSKTKQKQIKRKHEWQTEKHKVSEALDKTKTRVSVDSLTLFPILAPAKL